MKKFLPQGFTLIELLVVIAIIAILSTIGIVVFSSASKKARDAKRIKDVDSVANALETNFASGYALPTGTQFQGNIVPADPLTSKTNCGTGSQPCDYCFVSSAGNYTTTDCGSGSSNQVGATITPAAAPGGVTWPKAWIVCANLEASSAAGVKYYCRQNSQ